MRVMRWQGTGGPLVDMGAWGGDDDELGIYVRRFENEIHGFFPNIHFERTPPHDVYVLLDSANLAVLLNGDSVNLARAHIDASSLITASGYLSDMTTTESPRQKWSHGH